jgi:hypothetical protein
MRSASLGCLDWGSAPGGWDAINPATNAAIPNRDELDLWAQYRPSDGPLKGLRVKLEYSDLWATGQRQVRSTRVSFHRRLHGVVSAVMNEAVRLLTQIIPMPSHTRAALPSSRLKLAGMTLPAGCKGLHGSRKSTLRIIWHES